MRLASIHRNLQSTGDASFEDTMMMRDLKAFRRRGAAAAAGLWLLLGHAGCNLDKVQIPPLSGPSELALSVKLDAFPDVIVADGHSTAAIQATVRNENGQFVSGRQIFFTIASAEGFFGDIGSLTSTTAFTGNNGIAQVIYKAPARTDATANQTVLVMARPVTSDANGAIYREVRIELRSAEPFLFPRPPGSACGFVVEPTVGPEPGGAYKVNSQILFQSTGGADIVRFEWDFGDGTSDDKPQENHAYAFPDTYTVTLTCTNHLGGQSQATRDFVIVP